jgi:hypothetical protein
MILLAFHPNPNGYPTRFKMKMNKTIARGKRNTSVLDKNGSAVNG